MQLPFEPSAVPGRARNQREPLVDVDLPSLESCASPAPSHLDVDMLGNFHALLEELPAVCWATDTELGLIASWGAGPVEEILTDGRESGAALVRLSRRALLGDAGGCELDFGGRTYGMFVGPLHDAAGDVAGTVGIGVDISDRKQAEEQVRRQARLLTGIATAASHLLTGPDLHRSVNEALGLIGEAAQVGRVLVFEYVPADDESPDRPYLALRYRWTRDPLPGDRGPGALRKFAFAEAGFAKVVDAVRRGEPQAYVRAELDPAAQAVLRRYGIESMLLLPVLVKRRFWGVLGLYDCDGERTWSPAEESVMMTVAADVGAAIERKRAEETIHFQAYHDLLTNLPNRLLFHDRVSQALVHTRRSGQLLGVLLADLDRFKLVNDTLGHTFGDELLLGVAQRLLDCAGEGDTVARMGGDEFAVLLPDLDHVEDAVRFVQRVMETFQDPFRLQGHELYVTVSVGISLFPFDGSAPQSLLMNADTALVRAKHQGGCTYQLYSPEMNATAFEHLLLENNLRHALANEEFRVFYQPIVDMQTGRIDELEALVRWQHPHLGIVPPSEFIPLAESTGLIVPIGDVVMRTSCAQIPKWCATSPHPIGVAVNISPLQFIDRDLVGSVRAVLDVTGLDPALLELELTESILLDDVDTSVATLRGLKDMGVRLAIDDFGIGYSSLAYLKRLPVDTLKIDRVFVKDVRVDRADRAIAKAIIDMAHSLGMQVTAEGVETKEQLDFFKRHGCDRAQGFLFSGPQPASVVERMLATGASDVAAG
jgi:diguanylate cyclase (GGDEF)-like protein